MGSGFAATATQQVRGIGRLAVDSAIKLAAGETLPAEQLLPGFLTDFLGLLLLLNTVLVIMLYAVTRRTGYLLIGSLGVALSGVVVGALSALRDGNPNQADCKASMDDLLKAFDTMKG